MVVGISHYATRAACPHCGQMKDRASNGRIRKHMAIVRLRK